MDSTAVLGSEYCLLGDILLADGSNPLATVPFPTVTASQPIIIVRVPVAT